MVDEDNNPILRDNGIEVIPLYLRIGFLPSLTITVYDDELII
jgi:hypothetical protein